MTGMRCLPALLLLSLAACETKPAAVPAAKAEALKKKEPPPHVFRVKLNTTKGDIVLEIRQDWSPRGAVHFHELVTAGFYDGVKFHRVLKTMFAQFGINGLPNLDQLYAMMRIPDDPVKRKNKRGTITYAKLGADSRTTELFINLRDNSQSLDAAGFAPIGHVVEGMEVADKLAYLYGELQPRGGGPDANRIHREGNAYLEREFGRLDAIRKAAVIQ
ncbi:MAG: peptidylprolyl isomerase [Acidobacteria bacterium]|nr:peptidylprolyl isomerase [Acidobacteriota bacterium]